MEQLPPTKRNVPERLESGQACCQHVLVDCYSIVLSNSFLLSEKPVNANRDKVYWLHYYCDLVSPWAWPSCW